jgi:hypothetical protein
MNSAIFSQGLNFWALPAGSSGRVGRIFPTPIIDASGGIRKFLPNLTNGETCFMFHVRKVATHLSNSVVSRRQGGRQESPTLPVAIYCPNRAFLDLPQKVGSLAYQGGLYERFHQQPGSPANSSQKVPTTSSRRTTSATRTHSPGTCRVHALGHGKHGGLTRFVVLALRSLRLTIGGERRATFLTSSMPDFFFLFHVLDDDEILDGQAQFDEPSFRLFLRLDTEPR